MISMTGYGAYRLDSEFVKANLSLKSVNSRFFDLSIQMPAYLAPIEQNFREKISASVFRGKLDLHIKLLSLNMASDVIIDSNSAKAISASLKKLCKELEMDDSIYLNHLLGFEGIISYERNIDTEALWKAFLPALEHCIADLNKGREREGQETRRDLEEKLSILESNLGKIELMAPEQENRFKAMIKSRFEEVLGTIVEENRMLTELAALLVKYSINEEIVRLRSHIEAFRLSMDEKHCGKKLDFICQEINRETNTIGSKSTDSEISRSVIKMKDAVENMREQIRNIE